MACQLSDLDLNLLYSPVMSLLGPPTASPEAEGLFWVLAQRSGEVGSLMSFKMLFFSISLLF